MGGTALVHGSHKLSVTAELLGEDENGAGVGSDKELQRQLLQLRTLRPALADESPPPADDDLFATDDVDESDWTDDRMSYTLIIAAWLC